MAITSLHAYFPRPTLPSAWWRWRNVIGGGDWAGADRADAMRAWSAGQPVVIRSPNATAPAACSNPCRGTCWRCAADGRQLPRRRLQSPSAEQLLRPRPVAGTGHALGFWRSRISPDKPAQFHEAACSSSTRGAGLVGMAAGARRRRDSTTTAAWYWRILSRQKQWRIDFTRGQLANTPRSRAPALRFGHAMSGPRRPGGIAGWFRTSWFRWAESVCNCWMTARIVHARLWLDLSLGWQIISGSPYRRSMVRLRGSRRWSEPDDEPSIDRARPDRNRHVAAGRLRDHLNLYQPQVMQTAPSPDQMCERSDL
jgi:hypothetical protein